MAWASDPPLWRFGPASVETSGRLGQMAMKFLYSIGDNAASPWGVTRASFVNDTLRELSVGPRSGVFLSHRAYVGMLARSSGASFWAGLNVPMCR
jgi:hypothetical protein